MRVHVYLFDRFGINQCKIFNFLLMNLTLNQAHIFRFLSLCFAYPNEGFFKNLELKLKDIKGDKSDLEVLYKALKAEELEMLQGEYTRLFITGYPKTPCPPYESVQLEGRIMGKAADRVQQIYREWEMTVEPGILDHISTELEFCAFLCSASTITEAKEEAETAFQAFMAQHIMNWVPDFLQKLQTHAKFQVYKELAKTMESQLNVHR